MKTDDRYSDQWARVVFRADAVFEALYRGETIDQVLIEDVPEVRVHNEHCADFDHPDLAFQIAEPLPLTPEAYHQQNCREWFMPIAQQAIDMRGLLRDRCTSEAERQRVADEMDLFEARDLVPMLRYLHYMIAHLTANGVWWGVGRGSCCASYCLFLLGVHKVNALAFDLDIREFLK